MGPRAALCQDHVGLELAERRPVSSLIFSPSTASGVVAEVEACGETRMQCGSGGRGAPRRGGSPSRAPRAVLPPSRSLRPTRRPRRTRADTTCAVPLFSTNFAYRARPAPDGKVGRSAAPEPEEGSRHRAQFCVVDRSWCGRVVLGEALPPAGVSAISASPSSTGGVRRLAEIGPAGLLFRRSARPNRVERLLPRDLARVDRRPSALGQCRARRARAACRPGTPLCRIELRTRECSRVPRRWCNVAATASWISACPVECPVASTRSCRVMMSGTFLRVCRADTGSVPTRSAVMNSSCIFRPTGAFVGFGSFSLASFSESTVGSHSSGHCCAPLISSLRVELRRRRRLSVIEPRTPRHAWLRAAHAARPPSSLNCHEHRSQRPQVVEAARATPARRQVGVDAHVQVVAAADELPRAGGRLNARQAAPPPPPERGGVSSMGSLEPSASPDAGPFARSACDQTAPPRGRAR